MAIELPSDAELDTMIRARLAYLGVDLSQLHPTEADPDTGSPSQQAVLASLRSFMAGTVAALAAFEFPPAVPAEPAAGAPVAALAQQVVPPAFYPSIGTAWTQP